MLSFCLGEARTSHRHPAASAVIIQKIRSPIQSANQTFRRQNSHVPAVHILLFSAESVVAGYALRHRAQQYSGQKKNSFCPSLPLPRFQHLKAFFPSLHTAVFPSALVQFSIERASAFPCSSSPQPAFPSRHKSPIHSCRLCASVTAHSSMALPRSGAKPYSCLFHPIPSMKFAQKNLLFLLILLCFGKISF